MDFNAILGALPTLGGYGLPLLFLAYIGKQWLNSDARYKSELEARKLHYETEIKRITDSYNAELKRKDAVHDEEIADLKLSLLELKEEVIALRSELKVERQARLQAELDAHQQRIKDGKK